MVDRQRIVWVVGASSGIGAATARLASERGYHVVLSSRDREALADVASTLAGPSDVLPLDVTAPAAVRDALADVLGSHGHLDAVVLTAQTMAYGRIEDVPEEVFSSVVDVATHGTANVARAVLPAFRAAGRGTLVVVNSLVGEVAVPKLGTYACAKWGQLGLARSLQLEVRDERDVHVCIVSPGAIDTPIYQQAADYAGQAGHPPPPVLPAGTMAEAVLRCLRHPRRHVEVGPANVLTVLGFRLMPWLYDRIVGRLVELVIFRGAPTPDTSGNVLTPAPSLEAESGGWTTFARRRRPLAAHATKARS
ncbi:SDR family oxidoreductase [Jatrophihabitans endophyticus]|uniref:SDR family NAD(P)-dependent oxidoreductase n=1 Tax=Jatrophihabitans endophyticus TaxID=1206085 RepID=UPI0019DF8EFD|nr:SDR family NAD(P)-dependent oxidoreductase [Jatrophihabitans endophyticus]MBE7190068.1 SDR family NAD(P)-dependent oxidoreductase [Jatrophihabitans endophyticus]